MIPHAAQMTRESPTEPDLSITPPGVMKIPEPHSIKKGCKYKFK